jgi:hypothetical protein
VKNEPTSAPRPPLRDMSDGKRTSAERFHNGEDADWYAPVEAALGGRGKGFVVAHAGLVVAARHTQDEIVSARPGLDRERSMANALVSAAALGLGGSLAHAARLADAKAEERERARTCQQLYRVRGAIGIERTLSHRKRRWPRQRQLRRCRSGRASRKPKCAAGRSR